MTTGPMIDATVVENLILTELQSVAESQGIRVIMPHEAPPSTEPDQIGDSPITRWCRLNPIILTPVDDSIRNNSGDTDTATATVTITVGVAPAAMDPDQGGTAARLNADVMIVASSLHGASLDHDATTHRARFGAATRRVEPIGEHELLATGIVTVNATVTRSSGRTAVLTT